MALKAPDPYAVMYPVRCSSCLATIAWSDRETVLRNRIFCSEWCAREPPVTESEERNDRWRILAASGVRPVEIARRAGAAHSQVYKVLAKQ